ncbi:uncharacterized protein [Dendrobates tinctorius]|uniref:uncharacterized protein n=1 Tax=Dendrobates tinctorius TaxID=92724 RepID=UPI003CCA29D9
MDLRPTETNITERETASNLEAQIDPGLDVVEGAGPSSAPSSDTNPPQPSTPPPAASSQQANPEEHGNSSSPTLALDTSPQATPIPRRGRYRREGAATGIRRQVDRGVLDYLSSAAHDDGEEAYGRSLAQYLRTIPWEFRLRARGSLQIVLDSCTPPNHPGTVFRFLERWQLSSENLVFLQGSQAVQGPACGEPLPPPRMSPPPPRMPTPPPPMPTSQIWPQQAQYIGHSTQGQYGQYTRTNVGGWPQHGYGTHGHHWGYGQIGQ